MPGAPRAAEAPRGAAVDASDASAQRWARRALFSLGYPRSRYRTPETDSSVPMRRSSGELDVNMPPPLDSDTPLSSARALDMATAGAFTTRGVLTGSGARMPRNAEALASTHADSIFIVMQRARCPSTLRSRTTSTMQSRAWLSSNFDVTTPLLPREQGKILTYHPYIAPIPSSTISPSTGRLALPCAVSPVTPPNRSACDDVPTALRQNPAAKDQSRLAREALMQLCAQPAGQNKGQRSPRLTSARRNYSP